MLLAIDIGNTNITMDTTSTANNQYVHFSSMKIDIAELQIL